MILSGLSYEKLNQKDKAMKVLNDLIIEYPRSIYAQEARDKIRFLREDKNF
jgi:outer membrane protein assembly factor BamD (BamD/ComL family)